MVLLLALALAAPVRAQANGATPPPWRALGGVRAYSVPERAPIKAMPLDGAEDMSGSNASPDDGEFDLGPGYVPNRYAWQASSHPEPRRARVSDTSPGLRGAPAWRSGKVHRRALAADRPWAMGTSSWQYKGEQGLRVSLGNRAIAAPAWARGASLGGITVARKAGQVSSDDVWAYSVSLGAIDQAPNIKEGDLDYGERAAHVLFSYGLLPDLTMESQLEVAPHMVTTGLGGEYKTQWGAWTAGVAQASHSLYKGWRYQAGYAVDVAEDLSLSWMNEQYSAGFVDLSTYSGGPAAVGANRHRWSATVPTRRWGDISGTFERLSPTSGDSSSLFGLTQQFWYSPNLRVGISTRRELRTGDYDVGVRLSVSIF
ncbi:hypothetical protein [Pusillimonas sp. ANT_WB101]|uniref:hypothetical protein n=1 Tax=Pusillimonas sp. ANT_WB101 TaxID=2597356 RepID=UPI0011ED7135|nr:hypothetical protein [Pusillimonas sp. ANT_WB101]KAA0890071.1 hypothetical protein FQ179_17155 [Pusillimonas sp. ANT_WB101]